MGAKDLFKSLFFPNSKPVKKSKKKVSSKKTHLKDVSKQKTTNSQPVSKSSHEKREIELLKQKISDQTSTPEGSKKAAMIIEKMLNKK